VFEFLDQNFNTIETLVKSTTKSPFDQYYQRWLNEAYFLRGGLGGHSFWRQPWKDCKVDIYDLDKKKLKVSLQWEQSNPPSQSDINNDRNFLFTSFVEKLKSFYVIGNSSTTKFGIPPSTELLVFNEKGKLILRIDFPYKILRFQKITDDTLIYVMDDDEDISYIDLMSILRFEAKK
jgi:hypothetical protein